MRRLSFGTLILAGSLAAPFFFIYAKLMEYQLAKRSEETPKTGRHVPISLLLPPRSEAALSGNLGPIGPGVPAVDAYVPPETPR